MSTKQQLTVSTGEATGDGDVAPQDLNDGLVEGLIIESGRGIYQVETPAGMLSCTIRGRLRKELVYALSATTTARRSVKQVRVQHRDPVSVGDRVRVRVTGPREGVVEAIVARAGGAFTRRDPQGKGQLTAIAGLDQLIAVFAAREPEPHLGLLDRFLVLAESQELSTIVCVNKVDLGVDPTLAARLAVYERIGYPVIQTSVALGAGLEELRARLAGHTSALLGPSGVGKSSLLNAVQPGLGLQVGAVSSATHKGRHTTTGTHLFPLTGPEGGAIADTAGIRALALGKAETADLDWAFPEFRPFLGQCRLNDCSHIHEPDCAVRAALARGEIDQQRYTSYCRLYRGDDLAGGQSTSW